MDKLSIVLAKEEHLNDIVDVVFSSSQESGRLDNHQFGREALMAYIAFVDENFGEGVGSILAYRDGKPDWLYCSYDDAADVGHEFLCDKFYFILLGLERRTGHTNRARFNRGLASMVG